MEGRIEAGDLNGSRKCVQRSFYPRNVMGLVQGGERNKTPELFDNVVVDDDRLHEIDAAMHDAMAYGDYLLVAMGVVEPIQDRSDGRAVVDFPATFIDNELVLFPHVEQTEKVAVAPSPSICPKASSSIAISLSEKAANLIEEEPALSVRITLVIYSLRSERRIGSPVERTLFATPIVIQQRKRARCQTRAIIVRSAREHHRNLGADDEAHRFGARHERKFLG